MVSLPFSSKYKQLFTTNTRYVHLWGGRGRGGSFTATQYALHLMTEEKYFRGYIMREVAEDIRESLWRDFKDRVESAMTAYCPETGNYLLSKGFNKSSGKRTAKLKSLAGATHVFIEEADEISEEEFRQLDDSLRTVKANIQIVMIFNAPSKNHWIWKKWYNLVDFDMPGKKEDDPGYYTATLKKQTNCLSIFSTYLDNIQNLDSTTISNFEAYKESDYEYYYTMILGLISEGMRGRIYKNWKRTDTMPNLYPKFYGLDFGFNDPVVLVELESHNKNLWVDEVVYEQGITNDTLNQLMIDRGVKKHSKIYADSAEPKDIKDLQKMGWNVVPAKKYKGSVTAGIKFIKKYNTFVTERSENIWSENENYRWRLDRDKKPTDEPEDKHNHAMDALNYGTEDLRTGGGFTGISF
jgi:phage terminase large subunit